MRSPFLPIVTLAIALSLALPAIPTSEAASTASTLLAEPAAPPAHEVGSPTALAVYYPWFDYSTWEAGITPSLPAEPYHSGDPETIRRHVAEAKHAGLDGLVSAYFGPAYDNPTEANLRTLLDEAAEQGIGVAVLLETNSPEFFPTLQDQKDALWHVLNVHAQHPGYLRIDGKPAIFVWQPRAIFNGGWRVNRDGPTAVAAWQAVIDELDPERQALWIAEGEYTPYLQVFDGMFPYSIAWSSNPAAQLHRYAAGVRSYPEKYWFATAMPGYDDTLVRTAGAFAVDREWGGYYMRTLDAALSTSPDGLMIVSFNEWVEGHAIETGAEWGSLYLDITRSYVDWWRGG